MAGAIWWRRPLRIIVNLVWFSLVVSILQAWCSKIVFQFQSSNDWLAPLCKQCVSNWYEYESELFAWECPKMSQVKQADLQRCFTKNEAGSQLFFVSEQCYISSRHWFIMTCLCLKNLGCFKITTIIHQKESMRRRRFEQFPTWCGGWNRSLLHQRCGGTFRAWGGP